MYKTIRNLPGAQTSRLKLPVILMILDSAGAMITYIVLYLGIVDLLRDELTSERLINYTIICVCVMVFRIIIYRQAYLLSFTRSVDITYNMRLDLANHFRKLSSGHFDQNSSGHLLNTLTNDISSFEAVLSHAFPFIMKTAAMAIALVAGSFFINWKLAVVECIVIVIAFPILSWGNRLVEKYGTVKRNLTEKMVSIVIEYVKGIKVFKSYNMTGSQFGRMLSGLEDVRKTSIDTEKKMAVPTSMYSIVVSFIMPLCMMTGCYMLIGEQVTAEDVVAFIIMSLALANILTTFEHYYNMLKDLNLASENLEKAYAYKPLMFKEEKFDLHNFSVEFENVSFSYISDKKVLSNINLKAASGTTTALIGPSGSGKSTIISLLARFWDTDEGKIKIGGKDIRNLNPDWLLTYVSEVFQESVLLSDTIYNNIKVGNLDATEEEVKEAAEAANCHEFISRLPDGYQTMVSEGGASLSGGGKQRIAIARAILKDAPILLLDESTASLDADNEEKINKALDDLMKDKTVFVIAHRLNTIKNADQIVLINKGMIEETGSHEFLMKKRGHYYEMVKEQENAQNWIGEGA